MAGRQNIVLLFLFLITLMLWQCDGYEEEEIRLLTFQGSGIGRPSGFFLTFSPLDSLDSGNLVVRHEEWLWTDSFWFSVRKDLPDTLHFQESDSLLYINGDLAAISFSGNNLPSPFFDELSAEDISRLRSIQFEESIADSVKLYLKKIALQNPKVDIVYSSDNDSLNLLNRDLLWLSNYFQPRSLFLINETDSVSFSVLTKFPSLENLLINLADIGKLPRLPHLKEVILLNNEDSTSMDPQFFTNNPGLKSLTILGCEGYIDWTILNKLKNLRHLAIDADSIDLSHLYVDHPHLKSFRLNYYGEGGSVPGIFKKNKLQWLSLNSDNPFFGHDPRVLKDSFPELEYLEFGNNDSLFDYGSLKDLKKMKYLVVSGEAGLDSTLYHLDHLSYLSLPEDFLEDSNNLAAVKAALPNTIITPNSGACVGSGWLLLIIPLAAFWFYLSRSQKKEIND